MKAIGMGSSSLVKDGQHTFKLHNFGARGQVVSDVKDSPEYAQAVLFAYGVNTRVPEMVLVRQSQVHGL